MTEISIKTGTLEDAQSDCAVEMEICDINSIFIKVKRWLDVTNEKYAMSALDDFAKSLSYNLMLSNEHIL